ncbi:MAG: ABC transporter permease [Pseudomonadales bacterium]|jgi:putative ABC transport system permease protein
MTESINTIPLLNLAIAVIPVMALIFVMNLWSLDSTRALYGVGRMLGQLLLIGYVLAFIFESDSGWITFGVLLVMVVAASWIALATLPEQRLRLFYYALVSIVVAGGLTLVLVTQFVLSLSSWYSPRHVIPLAGMIFATAMNSISLSAERLTSELARGVAFVEARSIALNASLLPTINSLFAVGLVSLPGMMTGQILSGIAPFVAARYQIMVMCMLFTASGFSAILFLIAAKKTILDNRSA